MWTKYLGDQNQFGTGRQNATSINIKKTGDIYKVRDEERRYGKFDTH